MDQAIDPDAAWQSHHARTRCQQRGVHSRALRALLIYADRHVHIGSSCTAITLSRTGAAELRREGCSDGDVDRAMRQAAVIGPDGTLVTVLVPSGRRGRRYRCGINGRRQKIV
jgi:hypothetical protein